MSDTNQKEQKTQSDFKDNTGWFLHLYGKPCSSIVEYQTNCLETSKNDLNLIIKEKNQDSNIILTVSKFVEKPLLCACCSIQLYNH
jgi:hypothetical protein